MDEGPTARHASIDKVIEQSAKLARIVMSTRRRPFADRELSRRHLDALFVLAHSAGEVRASRLAVALRMTPGAITAIVDRLAAEGLVYIAVRPGDGRVRMLRLTAAARSYIVSNEAAVVADLTKRFDEGADDDLVDLARIMVRVRYRT